MLASELASWVGGRLVGADRVFSSVAPLESAGPDQVAFHVGPMPVATEAGVLLAKAPVEGRTVVVVDDPKLAFILLLRRLFPEIHPEGVQPGAFVHPSARIGRGSSIYPGAYVGANVEIGEGSVLFPNCCVLDGTVIGRRCVIGPGAIVGYAGFGVHPGPDGPVAVPQIGRVVLGDDVHIGANTCVDRAFLQETRVGDGCKVDNLVQIGHNCDLGKGVVIAAQSGLSGSVRLGDGVILGGQVGIADHVRVGSQARIGAQSGVHRNLKGGRSWLGTPAIDAHEAARVYAASHDLPELLRRVRRIERALEAAGIPVPPAREASRGEPR